MIISYKAMTVVVAVLMFAFGSINSPRVGILMVLLSVPFYIPKLRQYGWLVFDSDFDARLHSSKIFTRRKMQFFGLDTIEAKCSLPWIIRYKELEKLEELHGFKKE
jgi:hypothetical protein